MNKNITETKSKNLKKKEEKFIINSNNLKPIDDFDWKVINLLVNNGRISNIDIAKILNTSEATIRRRIDNLLKKGVIRGFAALLDYNKLGKTLKTTLQLKVKTSDLNKVADFLLESNDTCGIYRVIGSYNLYTEMIFENIKKFQAFIDELSQMDNIDELNYHIVTHSFKCCPWSGV